MLRKELGEVMGGKVLELESDKLIAEGIAEGVQQGIARGIAKGIAEGEN